MNLGKYTDQDTEGMTFMESQDEYERYHKGTPGSSIEDSDQHIHYVDPTGNVYWYFNGNWNLLYRVNSSHEFYKPSFAIRSNETVYQTKIPIQPERGQISKINLSTPLLGKHLLVLESYFTTYKAEGNVNAVISVESECFDVEDTYTSGNYKEFRTGDYIGFKCILEIPFEAKYPVRDMIIVRICDAKPLAGGSFIEIQKISNAEP